MFIVSRVQGAAVAAFVMASWWVAPHAAAQGAAAPPASPACVPQCRTGFACVQVCAAGGRCVSACNPACASNELCVAGGRCVSACNPPCGAGAECLASGECVTSDAPPVARAPAASPGPAPSSLPPPGPGWVPPPAGSTAPAQPGYATVAPGRRHDGFFLSLSIGTGVLASASGEYDGVTVEVSSPLVATQFELGGTVAPGFVIGGGSYPLFLVSPEYSAPGLKATGDLASLAQIGPFGRYYFDPTKGGFVFGAPVITVMTVPRATVQSPSSLTGATLFDDAGGTGFGLVAGGGYGWWIGQEWSFELTGRLSYATAKIEEDSGSAKIDTEIVSLNVLLGLAYH
jgi:hypothetical protein